MENLISQKPTSDKYYKAYLRQKQATTKAEELLETKARDLYIAKQKLEKKYQDLESAKSKIEKLYQKLKKNQTMLIQSEKMASLGQLTAGLAHEINNPIGFIFSNLSTLSKYLKSIKTIFSFYENLEKNINDSDFDQAKSKLETIEDFKNKNDFEFIIEDLENLTSESLEGAERVKGIIQNLKTFSRSDSPELKEFDINSGIEATLKIIWNELKFKCSIHKNIQEIPLVRCYPGQINQVFMNLLINAGQAIEEKGSITIETKQNRDFVEINISDTGCGIPQEKIDKIFDPFFTTKPIGIGTGLGLSISYGIIEKHQGTLNVQSTVGQGTTFSVHLPIEGPSEKNLSQ